MSKSSHEIALDFTEKFQAQYPNTDSHVLMEELRVAIDEHTNSGYKAKKAQHTESLRILKEIVISPDYDKVRAQIFEELREEGFDVTDCKKVEQELVQMPKTLTAENGSKGLMSGEYSVKFTTYYDDEGGESHEFVNEETIPWTTIKDMYKKLVEYHT